jgi:hypothetical protein
MNRARGGADEKTIEDKSPMRATIQRTAAIGMNPAASIETGYQGPTTIYCQSTGSEGFLRRAVKKMGWSEVPPSVNMFKESNFHIRFSISDLEGTTDDLRKNHFYNHHPNNREITTKSGLCKNLWQGCFGEYEHRISSMFPRCYDLSDAKQALDFIKDFNQTAVLSIIKIYATHYHKIPVIA